MAEQQIVSRISQKLFLPENEVRSHVLPGLSRLTTQNAVHHYLLDFLGPSPETISLAREYISSRQRPKVPSPLPSAASVQEAQQPPPTQQQQRTKGHQGQLDFEERLPAEDRAKLKEIDAQIASLTYSSGSSEADGPSKRQFKKGKSNACFCHARTHSISDFTPMCPRCALPLCQLQAPLLPCPSCDYSPLLTTSSRTAHLERLEQARKRHIEQVREELRQAPERFPELVRAGVAPVQSRETPAALPPREFTVVSLSIGSGAKRGSATKRIHRTVPKKSTSAVSSRPESEEEQESDPRMRPVSDPWDDMHAAPPDQRSRIEGRPFANPNWPDSELYSPAERLDDVKMNV